MPTIFSRVASCTMPRMRDRMLALPLLCLPLFCLPGTTWAAGAIDTPGAQVLDTAAIAVNMPARATYETVTRAGKRLVAGGEHGLIALSDDNGTTWRQAQVPVSATILQIRFADAQVGWAVGAFGVVLHTIDGGSNWTLQLTGIRAAAIMVDAAKAAVAAAPPVTAPTPAAAAASAAAHAAPADSNGVPAAGDLGGPAIDPAVSTVPPRLRRALSFQGDGPDKPFLVLQVQDADHARIIGAYDMAFETADGGKSWTEWDQRIDDTRDLHPYAMVGTGASVVLAGEQGLLLVGDPATGLKSVASPPYDGSYFGALDAGAQGLFVFGLLGHLYHSTDGGHGWTQIPDPSQATLSTGLMLGDGKVLFADLQGRIWRLEGGQLIPSAAAQPWPITDMVEAADGSVVMAGLGGLAQVDRAAIDKNVNVAG